MSFWVLAPLVAFLGLALRKKAPIPRRFTWAFIVTVSVLAYEASNMHAF